MQAAEHQIDLQRLVEKGRLAKLGVELLLEPVEQPRPEQTFQRGMVGGVRCRQQPRMLAQPVTLGERHRRFARGIAGRRVAQPVQQRKDLVEIAIGDQGLLDQRPPAAL